MRNYRYDLCYGLDWRGNIREILVPVKAQSKEPKRCDWCGTDALYQRYHDEEWGVPEYGTQALFERLVLEGMQAGLSWLTVLKKRERITERLYGFDVAKLAKVNPEPTGRVMASWLKDPGLIRHQGKLAAAVLNARVLQALNSDFSADLWRFVEHKPQQNKHKTSRTVPSITPAATAMAKWLKTEGFRFVGPTTCYAFMQSAGLVNDHLLTCHRHHPCQELASAPSSRI